MQVKGGLNTDRKPSGAGGHPGIPQSEIRPGDLSGTLPLAADPVRLVRNVPSSPFPFRNVPAL
jgi:hypothetical protein